MSIRQQAVPILAAALVSALLFGSVVAMTPEGAEMTFGDASLPTPYSADHARAQRTAPDEERAPTF